MGKGIRKQTSNGKIYTTVKEFPSPASKAKTKGYHFYLENDREDVPSFIPTTVFNTKKHN